MFADYHTHTVFSDGIDTPEDMVLKAIDMGMPQIGISDHSYTEFDESFCIKKDSIERYKSEINALKTKYRDKITVLCGIEQDIFSTFPAEGYDYIIGSVHYVEHNGVYYTVDESPQVLMQAVNDGFGGDIYLFIESYFDTVSRVAETTKCDIIGHFDLVSKFNENNSLFNEEDPRYTNAWKKAADALLRSGKVFEINTGAISRGYRTTPYPSAAMRKYISSKGGRFIWSSDAHSKENLCFGFEQ